MDLLFYEIVLNTTKSNGLERSKLMKARTRRIIMGSDYSAQGEIRS